MRGKAPEVASTAKSGFERLKISLLNLGASIGEAFCHLVIFWLIL
ncbi:hypothetical protein [Campylobacter sp. JMF_08 NE1]|nr:hypothetical protein [Campylobacter sp. JMF_08 NE1]MDA3048132.1 hypothetical protein [Campylobacter sp. JMF_08 NE1]